MNPGSERALTPFAKTSAEIFERAFYHGPTMQSIVRLPEGVLIDVNDSFLQMTGFRREEIIGKTPFDLDFWVFPERILVYREQLLKHGRVRDFEVEVRTKDGSIRTVLLCSEVVEIEGVPHSLSSGIDITPRKRAEAELRVTAERLRQSEERFSKAFRANPAIVALTRFSDGKFVSVNEAFLRAMGYTEDEVIGRNAEELGLHVPPEQRPNFLRRVGEQGFIRDLEFVVRTKQGQVRTLLVSGELTDIEGTVHLLTVGLDITERKEIEAKLRESETRLRESEARFSTAFQASPVFMTIGTAHDGRFVEVNEAFAKGLGLTRDEAVGHSSLELGLWVSAEERNRFHERLIETGSMHNVDCQVRSRDGTVRTMQLSAESVEINRVPHLLTFGVDMTERKLVEQALRESEARLRESEARARVLYDSISAGVVVQDETGFLQANPAALKLVGATRPEEFLGHHPQDFSAPIQHGGEDATVAAQRHVARAMAEGWDHFEWIGRRLDGTCFPLEVTLTTLQLDGRTVIQAVMFDLTERKLAETELQNALAKAQELNQLKTDFVSLVSHEFRTPLEIIMSSVDNLDRYHERLPAEKRAELLRTINKSVRRMAGMMEDVLLLGRFDSGGTDFKPAALDLVTFLQRVRDEMESATNRRCPISLRIDGELPSARADEAVLRHILTNLLSNAAKYSEAGQPVELTVRREGALACIRIVDRGCGIPAEDRKRLFQAFHRGANVRQIPGTGLGLLIVRRCVDLHGGEIRFESEVGEGTTFTVELPLFLP